MRHLLFAYGLTPPPPDSCCFSTHLYDASMPPAPPLSSSPLPSASKSASVGMADTQNRNQKELKLR